MPLKDHVPVITCLCVAHALKGDGVKELLEKVLLEAST